MCTVLDYTHHAQFVRVGLQQRLFGANNATALSKANNYTNNLKNYKLRSVMAESLRASNLSYDATIECGFESRP